MHLIGEELTDSEINFAQQLLKEQFKHIDVLNSTLLQEKQVTLTKSVDVLPSKNQAPLRHPYDAYTFTTNVLCLVSNRGQLKHILLPYKWIKQPYLSL